VQKIFKPSSSSVNLTASTFSYCPIILLLIRLFASSKLLKKCIFLKTKNFKIYFLVKIGLWKITLGKSGISRDWLEPDISIEVLPNLQLKKFKLHFRRPSGMNPQLRIRRARLLASRHR